MNVPEEFNLNRYDYSYPESLIAHEPIEPRDASKLLVFEHGRILHDTFSNLSAHFKSGDVLVKNISKVIPARLFVEKENGAKREILLIKKTRSDTEWEVLIRGHVSENDIFYLPDKTRIRITKAGTDLIKHIAFENAPPETVADIIRKNGEPPLPPYIRTDAKSHAERYQTVYASESGSVAAPTAGMHMTETVLKKLEEKGVELLDITLHVGYGTFQPVAERDIRNHRIHTETASVSKHAAERIRMAKKENRRIVALGTTTARTLEAFAHSEHIVSHGTKEVDIFIYSGYTWNIIDGLITNFHLPKSSLLMLIDALVGYEARKNIYHSAIENKYRLFSFGDASLLWKSPDE